MPHMVLIALEQVVLEALYVTIVVAETLCTGDRRLIWLGKVEEISLCHLFITVLRRILLGGQLKQGIDLGQVPTSLTFIYQLQEELHRLRGIELVSRHQWLGSQDQDRH